MLPSSQHMLERNPSLPLNVTTRRKRVLWMLNALMLCKNTIVIWVDLMDSFIGRYSIALKSRKWYLRIFYHLLDLNVVNAWLLYKRVPSLKGKFENIISQSKFGSEVANCLCNVANQNTLKRGRSSASLEQEIQAKNLKTMRSMFLPKSGSSGTLANLR